MTIQTERPAPTAIGNGAGMARRAEHRQAIEESSWPQERLVAVLEKSRRSRYEARLRTKDGKREILIGLRTADGLREFRPVGPALRIPAETAAAFRDLIDACIDALKDEGAR